MLYVLLGIVVFAVFAGVVTLCGKKFDLGAFLVGLVSISVLLGVVLYTDYASQTNDVEIWSGKIVEVEHKEEWDEYHPPRTETYTTTDSKGKSVTKTRTIAGYWEHHNAKNHVTTTDEGRIFVSEVPDGRRLNDKFVNSTEELEEYFPIGSPTASTHLYENKLKASYSVFKRKDIDLKDYEGGLPEYPTKVNSYLSIDRLLGDFKNKEEMSKYLDSINTKLNDTENPNNKEKVKSYKQANIMFVNFGDKSEDYGYALQDYWKNGAKNDFVVTFGTDKKGNVTWCHPFSWTDVEILKSDVREFMIGKNVNDFKSVIDGVSDLVENKFDRKQFAEFNYIQVEVRTFSKVIMMAIVIGLCGVYYFIDRKY